jgi:hypothetical protein
VWDISTIISLITNKSEEMPFILGKTYISWFEIIIWVSVAYNFQSKMNKIKLLIEYYSVTQKALFFQCCIRHIVVWEYSIWQGESNPCTLSIRGKVRYKNDTSLQNSVWKRLTFNNAIIHSFISFIFHKSNTGDDLVLLK